MEIKQLRYLVTAADAKSFSRAADILYTTQSTVSKVIKSLEDELSITLFERRQYGIMLTEKGKQIYDYACTTLESVDRIEMISQNKASKELRILMNPSTWMSEAFRDYYLKMGADEEGYSVITASTGDIIRRLSADIDQIGFVYVSSDQVSALETQLKKNHLQFIELTRVKTVLYLGEDYIGDVSIDENGIPLSSGFNLVQGYEDEYTFNSAWNKIEKLKKSRVAVVTNSDSVMSELLKNTDLCNISCAPLKIMDGETNGFYSVGRSLPIGTDSNLTLFGCLIRNDKQMNKQALDFLKFIKKRLE